eukprot:TRINITY_DN504_c0_g1_i3.p1 TRINITY_DN504_c0_g1~~TRINITY_DN504_c0_g1_i3.p1  ORF type:complete len:149 (-),score=33.52 TRINITY_DN504_c0_g1_i3:133-579(-)
MFMEPVLDQSRWLTHSCPGEWRGVNAGGCRNYDTWSNNPQYVLITSQRTNAFVTVCQSDMSDCNEEGVSASQLHPIGVYVINKDGDTVAKAPFTHSPEVSCELELDEHGSPYLMIPCTFEPGMEAKFTLTVFSPHPVHLTDMATIQQY